MKRNLEHLVFVYGTLKRGYGNNVLLTAGDSNFVGEFKTCDEWALDASGGVPFLHKLNLGFQVEGEVWQVDDKTLENLDRLEGHPVFYRREKIFVQSIDELSPPLEVWVYFITESDRFARRAFTPAKRWNGFAWQRRA